MAMSFSSHSLSEGRRKGRAKGRFRGFLCSTLTKRVNSGPESSPANGALAASLVVSRPWQIMISHLKGNFFAIAARNVESLTAFRITNVPTAPMFIISNFFNSFASCAGRHRFVPPTFTARRNTTEDTGKIKNEKLRNKKLKQLQA